MTLWNKPKWRTAVREMQCHRKRAGRVKMWLRCSALVCSGAAVGWADTYLFHGGRAWRCTIHQGIQPTLQKSSPWVCVYMFVHMHNVQRYWSRFKWQLRCEYGEAASRCRWKQIAARNSALSSNMMNKAAWEKNDQSPLIPQDLCLFGFIYSAWCRISRRAIHYSPETLALL